MEAFGEIVDPLTLFHEIAKRAVELLAISIARHRLGRPRLRRLGFLGHVVRSYGEDRNHHGQNNSPGDLLRPCSLTPTPPWRSLFAELPHPDGRLSRVHCGLYLIDLGDEFGLIARAVGSYSVDG